MLEGFDHAILGVADLARAEADLRGLGFTVTARPDVGATDTENRLICLADESYIEVFTLRGPPSASTHRWAPQLAKGDGWLDYSVHVTDAAAEAARLGPAGLPAIGPRSGGRALTDGRRWGVSVLIAGRGAGSPVLPFLIQDTESRAVRVPGGEAAVQPNGATGVIGVTLLTAALAGIEAGLTAIYGNGASMTRPDAAAARRYEFAGRWVDVIQPANSAREAIEHLNTRGEGVYEVTLGKIGQHSTGEGRLLPLPATHGARLRLAT